MQSLRSLKLVAVACIVLASASASPCLARQDEVAIDADASFILQLLSPLSTLNNRDGDKFECKVLSPSEYAGAVVSGYVRKVKNAGKGKGKSQIDLAFDRITLADGRAGDFNAQIMEVYDVENVGDNGRADVEGQVKGKPRTKVTVKRAAAGAATGAVIGGVFGGLKGAAAGAIIGAGVGAATTLAAEGPNLEFREGTKFSVRTNAPPKRSR